MSSYALRDRQRGTYRQLHAIKRQYFDTGAQAGETVTSSVEGSVETMQDRVTKPFIKGKTIANSHMRRTQTTKAHTPATGTSTLEYPGYSGFSREEGELFVDREELFALLTSQLNNFDYSSLVNLAATRALAGVRKPEVAGLVSIAEMKSTVQGLLNPLNGALKFLSTLKKRGKSRRSRNIRKDSLEASKALADQHLSVIFGLLPFISDVQGTLKALQAATPEVKRFTSRGEMSSMDSKSVIDVSTTHDDGNNVVQLTTNAEVTRTVTVRAYQLYETSVSLQNALGLSISDIPLAVWQTTSLSFVVDWFANVGDFIASLTPVAGITYITSGYTVTIVDSAACSYSTQGTHRAVNGWISRYTGGQQSRVQLVKERVPCTLFGLQRLGLKSNMHRDVLDAYKVTAAISLLTQRIKSL